eukprot:6095011-Prymnesium_polylepis.1
MRDYKTSGFPFLPEATCHVTFPRGLLLAHLPGRLTHTLARSSLLPLSRVVLPSIIRVPGPRNPACEASFGAPSLPFHPDSSKAETA